MMESLQDFMEDWEKEYSQQINIPEVDVIKHENFKGRRYSLDTEKLKKKAMDRIAQVGSKLQKENLDPNLDQNYRLKSRSNSKNRQKLQYRK